MTTYDKKSVFLRAFFKNDFPFMPGEKKIADKTIPKKTPTATEPKKIEPTKRRSAKNIRGALRSSEKEANSLLKAFERRDDYSLVDPREYYGALQTVNKRVLEWLSSAVSEMNDNEVKTIPLPVKGAKVKVRKIMGDMFSGFIIDKTGDIKHLYDRLTLPALASQICAVYEIYTPEKEEKFEESPRSLHSLREEIESINGELKGLKTKKDKDLVGLRLKGLIDNLAGLQEMVEGHQKEHAGHKEEFTSIHGKLEELKSKLPTTAPQPPVVDEPPAMDDKVPVKQVGEPGNCDDCGCKPCKCFLHLPRPTIEIEPNGKVIIFFKSDWSDLDKLNFMKSMRYVVDKKRK